MVIERRAVGAAGSDRRVGAGAAVGRGAKVGAGCAGGGVGRAPLPARTVATRDSPAVGSAGSGSPLGRKRRPTMRSAIAPTTQRHITHLPRLAADAVAIPV